MSNIQSSASKFILISAALVILIAGLKSANELVVPFILSIFIATISAPPLFWLTRKGAPQWLALTIVIGITVVVCTAVAMLVSNSLEGFTEALPTYREGLKQEFSGLISWLSEKEFNVSGALLTQYFDPGMAMQLVANTLSGFGNVLANSFLILLTVIFMLTEAASFPSKLSHLSANPKQTMQRFNHFSETVKRYMAIKTIMSLITGICISIWLGILGVNFAILWGVIAFFLNYVPNIGSIIAAVPAITLAFVQLGSSSALLVAAGYVLMNTIIGNILEPRYMGRGLGLSTLVVFLSLIFWGWVLGPVGMLLSVPLTMTLKIALESRQDTVWLAVVLGNEQDHMPGK